MSKTIENLKTQAKEKGIEVLKDTGWSDAVYGGRCIKDYFREVTFSKEPSSEELNTVKSIMQSKDCPGWTPIAIRKKDGTSYTFTTTWDSSD